MKKKLQMEGALPSKILSPSGPTDISAFTSAKVLGLYFSASWCGLCKEITPKLVSMYEEVNKPETQFHVLFVSGDEGQADFEAYYKTMPFFAVPLDDDVIEQLAKTYKVASMPTLVLIDKTGKVIKDKAHNYIQNHTSKTWKEVFNSWKALYP